MRFHRLLLSTVAFVSFSAFKGVASADESPEATADTTIEPVDSEKFEFQAEVSKVLDIVVNSLYQNKDVFLRELISNASDAIDKVRFLGIQKPEMLADKQDLEIRISYDEEANTLTISDSGIGMTKEDLVGSLGTVARSGTTKFMDALQEGAADISQIGMFGVGFYSSYLVADKVTVASKHPNDPVQHVWTSNNGDSTFMIGEDPRGNSLGRGTEITLHLKEDAEEYADYNRLEKLVSHYSEFITHSIYLRKTEVMEVPDEEDQTEENDESEDELDVSEDEEEDEFEEKPTKMKEVTTHTWEKANADAAIWNRPKEDISDDEYQDFWKLISKDNENATSWSHFDAEGNINFKSLVYVPTTIPFALRQGDFNDFKNSLKLYVRKVLISDEFELLPKYLSFVKGVVDSDDLPLNVNRETLQESNIISIIRKKVTRKVIDMIKKMADEADKVPEHDADVEIDEDGNIIEMEEEDNSPKKENVYHQWYENFAPSIKMGVMDDDSNRSRLAKLLRMKTSKSDGGWRSLAEYTSDMKDFQSEIYFIAGASMKEVEESPFMEKFNEKGLEVLYMIEPADEYMLDRMMEFDGKKFSNISKESTKFGDEDEDLQKRTLAAYNDKYESLLKFMNQFYGKAIMNAKISQRLGNIPAIVSSSQYGHSANMERLMRAQVFAHGQDESQLRGMRTLEINPRHPFMDKLVEDLPTNEEGAIDKESVSQDVKDSLWTLLDTALLNGGFTLNDGKAFTKRMMRTLKSQLAVDSLDLLSEIEPKVEEDVPPEPELDGDGINLDDFVADDLGFEDL